MTKRIAVRARTALMAVILTSACSDLTDVPTPEGRPDPFGRPIVLAPIDVALHAREELRAAALGRQERSTEDEFLRIERDLPGFGGLYIDTTTQRLTMFVKNPRDLRRAISALQNSRANTASRARLPETISFTDIDLRQGKYAFSELVAWKNQLFGRLLAVDAFLSIDADESINRIRIEVDDPTARSDVRKVLTSAGVPEDAARIDVGVRATMAQQNLTLQRRPAVAGYQIKNQNGALCSLGWNVRTIPQGERGFLTASHCSRHTIGSGRTGETIYQRNVDSRDVIGTVYRNAAWYGPGDCPFPVEDFPPGDYPHRCTRADAMFVRTAANDMSGNVALTTGLQDRNNRPGTRDVAAFFGNIIVAGGVIGQTTDKVGRSTGWTRGTNSGVCMNVRLGTPGGGEAAIICANRVTSASNGTGDSGAPVFHSTSGAVFALGIYVGGGPFNENRGTYRVCNRPAGQQCRLFYSPWSAIEGHLGRVFEPAP